MADSWSYGTRRRGRAVRAETVQRPPKGGHRNGRSMAQAKDAQAWQGGDERARGQVFRHEARIHGWEEIAAVLGWSRRTAIRHRHELRAHRAIFYQWLGKPPRKTVCSYESLLRLFLLTREDAPESAWG